MTRAERILIVEDEPDFAALLELWIRRQGWRTETARDGEQALRLFLAQQPDLVLLDLNLPHLSGWELIERIRGMSAVPVLMVTALGSEAEKVRGLVAGADDYITKPLSFPELIARIHAALRRARGAPIPKDDGVLEVDGLRIEPRTHRVRVTGVEVHLTPTEFRLLHVLAARPGDLLSHRDLLQEVWGPLYGDDTQVLRVTMRNLRAKLASAAPERRFITTEYGLGYRFEEASTATEG